MGWVLKIHRDHGIPQSSTYLPSFTVRDFVWTRQWNMAWILVTFWVGVLLFFVSMNKVYLVLKFSFKLN